MLLHEARSRTTQHCRQCINGGAGTCGHVPAVTIIRLLLQRLLLLLLLLLKCLLLLLLLLLLQ